MRKLFSKWVPRLLTPDQKHQRVEDSERFLDLFKRGKMDFLRQYVTIGETLIHHHIPETRRSSAEWTAAGESRSKRPKTQQWAGKVTTSVFWDAHGILFIDYLEKVKTIKSDYYMALMDRLSAEIKKKLPTIFSRSGPQRLLALCWSKKMLQGKRFGSNEEVIAETEAYFESKDEPFYKKGIEKIKKCSNECITLEGNYVDE